MSDYRIEYTIHRRQPSEDDFTDIGFGSSGAWSDVDQAVHMLASDVRNRQWETSEGMPDPSDIA